jgi:heterodisulfide reductase subunit A-like polyferredoxin
VKEKEPLTTDVEGIYVSGGALEPMNIKDSILTGFGAGILALKGADFPSEVVRQHERLYKENAPNIAVSDNNAESCLFYIALKTRNAIYYEFISAKFGQREKLKKAGKDVYGVTKIWSMPRT